MNSPFYTELLLEVNCAESKMPRISRKKKLIYLFVVLNKLRKRYKSIRNRKYQVNPLYRVRKIHGEYFTLIHRLEICPIKFFQYFRMSQDQFNFILSKIQDDIAPKCNLYREDCITSKEKLVLTLRFLATGATFADLSSRFLMGKTTVRSSIIATICAINKHFQEPCLPATLDPQDWLNIAQDFITQWHFPNCLGAVDGKHVKLFTPPKSDSSDFNYKKCMSATLMAVVDANYKFIMVSIGSHGSNSDPTVFASSHFGNAWINYPQKLNVPANAPLPQTNDPQPYVLIGDEAFDLKYNLLTPFPGCALTMKQKIYNYRLSRARRIAESSFDMLTHTWRILLKPLEVQMEVAKPVILCCCILHNFLQASEKYPENLNSATVDSVAIVNHSERTKQTTSYAINIRNKFADWFVAEGNVDFQHSMV